MNQKISSAANALASETMALSAERKRGDKLLQRMLPPAVTDALKRGIPVNAQQFDGATVSFRSFMMYVL